VGFGPCEVDPSVGLNKVKPTPKGFTQHKNCHSFLFVNVHHINSGKFVFGVNFCIFSILGIWPKYDFNTYKGFMWFTRFENRRILKQVPADSQIVEGFLNFLLSYLVYSQIWLNLHVGDVQFGYITKLKKRNPDWYQAEEK
jgi:hypothetical protein